MHFFTAARLNMTPMAFAAACLALAILIMINQYRNKQRKK